jgi:hypothetical protein
MSSTDCRLSRPIIWCRSLTSCGRQRLPTWPGSRGSSRDHPESGLRCYLAWCAQCGLDPLAALRPHLELYPRWMQEVRHFKPSTVSRRFSVAAGFYRSCVIDGIPKHSRSSLGPPARRASLPGSLTLGPGRRSTATAWLLPPASLVILDRWSPPEAATGPRSPMGFRQCPGPGYYSGCHTTRSNSLPSGSANVVWRTAATPDGSASDGSLISLSGLAPREVSRAISSS